jgi:hypothetical protein
MSDLGGVILTRTFSFGRERLRHLAAMDPAAPVAMVAPGCNPAPVVAEIQAAMVRARRHAAELEAALAVPPDTPERVQRAVDAPRRVGDAILRRSSPHGSAPLRTD